MNKLLSDPFKNVALPEVIEEYLDYGVARCCAFNRRGTLLATGTEDGFVVIWDFETRGVAKVLPGHNSCSSGGGGGGSGNSGASQCSVSGLSWSRSGRQLLSGGRDQRIILWDVLSGTAMCEVRLPSAVTAVSLSQRAPFRAAVSLESAAPVLVQLPSGAVTTLPSVELPENKPAGGKRGAVAGEQAPGVVLLSRTGGEVLLGQLQGLITVIDADSGHVLDVVRLPSAAKVVTMSLDCSGRRLLVNCSDRAVRLFELRPRCADARTFTPVEVCDALQGVQPGRAGSLLHEDCSSGGAPLLVPVSGAVFQNAVERNAWRAAAASGDGEHVTAGVAAQSVHRLYVWSSAYAKLEKILEGPRNESITDLAWHPSRSQMVTISGNGRVYIWAQLYSENWSAFAPDFQELEENVEYVEAEDEFDIKEKLAQAQQPAAAAAASKAPVAATPGTLAAGAAGGGSGASEGEDVDVLTRNVAVEYSSDAEDAGCDGDDGPLLWLPALVGQPPIGAGLAKAAGCGPGSCDGGGGGSSQDDSDGAGNGDDGATLGAANQQQRRQRSGNGGCGARGRDRKRARVRFNASRAGSEEGQEGPREEQQQAVAGAEDVRGGGGGPPSRGRPRGRPRGGSTSTGGAGSALDE